MMHDYRNDIKLLIVKAESGVICVFNQHVCTTKIELERTKMIPHLPRVAEKYSALIFVDFQVAAID